MQKTLKAPSHNFDSQISGEHTMDEKRKRKNKAKTFGGRQMAPLYFECESRIFDARFYFESHGNGS